MRRTLTLKRLYISLGHGDLLRLVEAPVEGDLIAK
jgi:hypothetical protein